MIMFDLGIIIINVLKCVLINVHITSLLFFILFILLLFAFMGTNEMSEFVSYLQRT